MTKSLHTSKIGLGLLVAGLTLLANSALAGGGGVPNDVPDAGSSALLITLSMSALAFGRKLLK